MFIFNNVETVYKKYSYQLIKAKPYLRELRTGPCAVKTSIYQSSGFHWLDWEEFLKDNIRNKHGIRGKNFKY